MQRSNLIKKYLAQYSRKIGKHHLVMGAMGNISLRDLDRRPRTSRFAPVRGRDAWIKKRGVWLERAEPSNFLRVNIRHPEPEIARKISKEINLHLSCFRARSDINAVIHTHPVILTALGTIMAKLGQKKAKFSQKLGSRVVIIRYSQPGSRELAKKVKKAIKTADAVVLANHGLVTVGRSLKEAYKRTIELENKASKLLMKAIICK